MNTLTAEHLLTGNDLLELQAQTGKNYHLIQGKPTEIMPSGLQYGIVAGKVFAEIYSFVKSRQLGYVLAAETGIYLKRNPDTVRAADVAFIKKDRLNESQIQSVGFSTVVPDLVVEVRSPNDRPSNNDDKLLDYQNAGVSLIWIIDPQKKQVEVCQKGVAKQTLSETDALDGGEVLDGFTLALKDIF